MSEVARWRLLHGIDAPPPARVDLVAGHVAAVLDAVDLRQVRIGSTSIVDRVYVAVRDRDWDTIPATITNLDVQRSDAGFVVSFDARHLAGGIDLTWRGTIVGDPDGTITCTMDGEARTSFSYCRIGFCVLHPDSLAGARYTARTSEGEVSGTLPVLIGPQSLIDGVEQPLFPAFDALELDTLDGGRVSFSFSGDLFETEDQRNWTDASFKTYCTPIGRGYPHQAEPGQRFSQSVAIRLSAGSGSAGRLVSAGVASATVTLGGEIGGFPSVGLGVASDGDPLTEREVTLLRALRLDHLRVDVRPGSVGWQGQLDDAVRQAARLGCALEVALFVVPGRGGDGAIAVAQRLAGAPVARWLVFDDSTAGLVTTPADLAHEVRVALASLGLTASIAGGTDGDFAELNRAHPTLDSLDAITYAVNPRVHASDDRSIMENVTAQGATVATARTFAGDRGVCVSPVTLAPRFNPAAIGSQAPIPDERELPSAVDWRQPTLLAAAWTIGSIASLASAGADSVTWFQTVGWRGLIEREAGSRLPERFASTSGMVFPVYHVFADLAELREGTLLDVSTSSPRALVGIAVRRGERVNGLFANLTPEPLQIDIGPLGDEVRYRLMDVTTVPLGMSDPDAFRRFGAVTPSVDGRFRLTLAAYATVVFGAAPGAS